MKTVLQITAYYPPHLGGVERVARALAEKLAERREVEVLTSAVGSKAGTESSGGVRVRRCRAIEAAHTPVAPGLFAALIRAPRGSVWHLHCAQAVIAEQVMFAALLRRQKYIFHFHLDVGVSGPLGRLLPFYKKHFFGRALRAAAGVIVLTREQAEFVQRVYRIEQSRVHVVPNGIAAEFFGQPRRRTDAETPLRLLYVGRLEAQKNVARLLDAMSLVQEKIELRIVGDGSLRAELEEHAARLGLNVEFAGSLYGDELLRAYAEADAFVLPSDREGMALVALEAMAAGLPVVATDVPGNRELLDGLGVLADPEPSALARALDSVAADAQLSHEVAERCASAARAYSWDVVADLVERVYDEVYA
jgi:glycosyltransferase involved in cell wall biosynthesis